MRNKLISATALLLLALSVTAATRVDVGRFSADDRAGWKEKSFLGNTRYELQTSDGQRALCAQSSAAASGLFHEMRIDVRKTPLINWSWKVERGLHDKDERSKPGDDYPARIYVVFSGGIAFWKTRAINYVWSSAQPVGAMWPNAFTGNAQMVAVESGPQRLGQWVSEQRDVLADYRALFGAEADDVDAVAIMTDTDNAGGSAAACYGDIYFESSGAPRDDP